MVYIWYMPQHISVYNVLFCLNCGPSDFWTMKQQRKSQVTTIKWHSHGFFPQLVPFKKKHTQHKRIIANWATQFGCNSMHRAGCSSVTSPKFYGFHLDVSKIGDSPQIIHFNRVSIINHPFWGTPMFGNTHLYHLERIDGVRHSH